MIVPCAYEAVEGGVVALDHDRLEDGSVCTWLVRLVVAVAVTSLAVHDARASGRRGY